MKNLFVLCFFFISINSFSQKSSFSKSNEKEPSKKIMQQANEKLELNNIDTKKANIDDWEKVLKEIGDVTKTENTLFCKVSSTQNLTLTFDKNQLIRVCEMYDSSKQKDKR